MNSANFSGAFGNSSIWDDGAASIVTTPTQSNAIKAADSNWLDNLAKIAGVGVSAYAAVETAKAAGRSSRETSAATEAAKTAAPVIATPGGGSAVSSTVLYVVGGVVALILAVLLIRPRR